LRLIAGFEAPDRGRIVLDGQLLANGGTAVPAHRRGIGVVAQDGALFPRLMLLDEPFSALDTALRASMRKAVAELLEAAGITTILVTHDQAEALSFADQVAVMREGRFSQVGTPRDLYFRPKDTMVAQFLGDAILLPARLLRGMADCAIGDVAADRSDAVRIMLRPEQIVLEPVSAAEATASEAMPAFAYGEVSKSEF